MWLITTTCTRLLSSNSADCAFSTQGINGSLAAVIATGFPFVFRSLVLRKRTDDGGSLCEHSAFSLIPFRSDYGKRVRPGERRERGEDPGE